MRAWALALALAMACGGSTEAPPELACRVAGVDYGPCPYTADSLRSWSCVGPCEVGGACELTGGHGRGTLLACGTR